MASLRFEQVEKRFGDVVAVSRLDLAVANGEFLTLLGPSGCGKTTTLRMVAGFVRPTAGRLLIDDEDVTHVPPQKRAIGMVFQDYALFPHLTVAENIGFGLVERRVPRERIRARVKDLLDLVRLPGVADRYPNEISGGQQQRIALARAVAHTPRLLLMDEPLGALDLKLREAMQIELRRIQQDLKITTIYVTHDQNEAMSMSDRIAVMNNGRIEQLDAPSRIYDAPATRFVASFVGKINFLDGQAVSCGNGTLGVETPQGILAAPPASGVAPGRPVTLAIRPEVLRLLPTGVERNGRNAVPGIVEATSYVGNLRHVAVKLDADKTLLLEARPDDADPSPGSQVTVAWDPARATLLSSPDHPRE